MAESHVTLEAETRDVAVNQGAWKLPEPGRSRRDLPEAFRGSVALPIPDSGVWPPGLGESGFLLFEVTPLRTILAADAGHAQGRVVAYSHCGVGPGDTVLGAVPA